MRSILKLLCFGLIAAVQLMPLDQALADAAFNNRWVRCSGYSGNMRFLIRSESALAGQIKGYLREGMRMVMTGPIDPSGVYFGFCSTRDCSSPTESTLPATSAYVDFDAGGNFTISLNDGGMVDSSEIVLIIEGVGSRGEIKYRIDNVLGSCYTDSLHN